MANINVTIYYDPVTDSFSQDLGNNVQVNDRGNNPIRWSIDLLNDAPGSIQFNTSTGIVFVTQQGQTAWPGDAPSGNANNWNSSINNQLQVGGTALLFYYQVNAWYTPPGGSAVAKVWDPDVEENPPSSNAAISLQ